MPVITALGLRWQIASDFIPILAAWGLLSHCVWFLIVGVLFLVSQPSDCAKEDSTNANLYESVVDGTLAMFAATCLIEIVLIIIGVRGEREHNRPCISGSWVPRHGNGTLCAALHVTSEHAARMQGRHFRSPSARR